MVVLDRSCRAFLGDEKMLDIISPDRPTSIDQGGKRSHSNAEVFPDLHGDGHPAHHRNQKAVKEDEKANAQGDHEGAGKGELFKVAPADLRKVDQRPFVKKINGKEAGRAKEQEEESQTTKAPWRMVSTIGATPADRKTAGRP